MKTNSKEIISSFPEQSILVVGDVVLDKFIYGNASRLSPEAPVAIVGAEREVYLPGGAGNTAANITSLNANAYLLGIAGQDNEERLLEEKLAERGVIAYLLKDKERPTTKKTRVIANGQQIVRIDYEKTNEINEINQRLIINKAIEYLDDSSAVIISDYDKGCITEKVAISLIEMCNKQKKPIIIDPKPAHKAFYKNAYLITPNRKESKEMDSRNLELRGKNLVNYFNSNLLITLGEEGMILFKKNKDIVEYPAKVREVSDIMGAGDTVVAASALALAAGATLEQAVEIANHAAGIVVSKPGTAFVTINELLDNFK